MSLSILSVFPALQYVLLVPKTTHGKSIGRNRERKNVEEVVKDVGIAMAIYLSWIKKSGESIKVSNQNRECPTPTPRLHGRHSKNMARSLLLGLAAAMALLRSPYCHSIQFEISTQPPLLLDAYETRRYLRHDHSENPNSSSSSPSSLPHGPLYRGMGTHFIYLWVGTPPQRVSVIVDTGSHHTAFPCKGCSNCGSHTDHYWDPKRSSTAVTQACGASSCRFSQSYTEGSSWQAYKVNDVVWIGGERADMLDKLPKYSVNFSFGCQTSETGLFRTQVENGIMGLSADPNTLPYVLHAKQLITSRSFTLCLLSNGGLMSIGDGEIDHPEMKYAQLVSRSGFYTIRVENILLKTHSAHGRATSSDKESPPEAYHDIGEPMSKINSGKGIIVDSGTTDSYLPASISASFKKTFQKLTGIYPSNAPLTLTPEQYRRLPIVIYRITAAPPSPDSNEKSHLRSVSEASATDSGSGSHTIDIEFPPWNYLEAQKDGKYVMRLYLTEGSGGVIGANMMIGHNILFEVDKRRVGFMKSDCKKTGQPIYDEMTPPQKVSP